MEMVLAISSLWSGKNLLDQGQIEEEEAPIIVEQDSSEDEEEQATTEPNPDQYKPLVPYPQALKRPQAQNS